MPFDPSVVGRTLEPHETTYDFKDVALYALACGATDDEVDLWLETRGPKVLPSFSVVWTWHAMADALPRLGGSFLTLVHGGHRLQVHRPLAPESTVSTRVTITGLYDKGKGALGVFRCESSDDQGPLAVNEWRIFYRGEGGFGGQEGPELDAFEAAPHPGGEADTIEEQSTQRNQALLYRLASGDMNPIHADPDIARSVGFARPILHGLCTFGFAVRALVHGAAGGDPDRLSKVTARFTQPVLPGDALRTRVWRDSDGRSGWYDTLIHRVETGKVLDKPAITQARWAVRP